MYAYSGFQTMWLEMMVEHHEGAVEMAQEEQDNGQYQPSVDLAGAVVETQIAEIEKIDKMKRDSAPDARSPHAR